VYYKAKEANSLLTLQKGSLTHTYTKRIHKQ
jgi:hypothetical protein